jgi:hypothetical protein
MGVVGLMALNLTAPTYLSHFLVLLNRSYAQLPHLQVVSETPIMSFVLTRVLSQTRATLFGINELPIPVAHERDVLKAEVEENPRHRLKSQVPARSPSSPNMSITILGKSPQFSHDFPLRLGGTLEIHGSDRPVGQILLCYSEVVERTWA